MEYMYFMFGDPGCIIFRHIMQTNRQTNASENLLLPISLVTRSFDACILSTKWPPKFKPSQSYTAARLSESGYRQHTSTVAIYSYALSKLILILPKANR